MSHLTWVVDDRQYVSGEKLRLGPWVVGGVHFDSLVAKDARDRYRATCLLPGISSGLGLHESREAAKERVEKAVNAWLAKIPPNAINAACAAV